MPCAPLNLRPICLTANKIDAQDNSGYGSTEPGDDFWQLNAFAGYRFPRRKAEVMIGLLNITDQDYRLNPLNIYNELPRERTLAFRFRLNF